MAKRTTAAGQVNAMHSAETPEHYLPAYIAEAARATHGGTIDLDPASCELANRTIQAARIFTKEDDGLRQAWRGNVLCNPPGGKDGGKSVQKQWWRRGAREWLAGRVDALLWVAFKVDFLQVTQVDRDEGDPLFGSGRPPIPLDGAICYPRERIAYLTPTLPGPTLTCPDRKPTARQVKDHAATGLCTGDSPPHASAIVYLPGRDTHEGLARFEAAFSKIGEVRWDHRAIARIVKARGDL